MNETGNISLTDTVRGAVSSENEKTVKREEHYQAAWL